MSGRAQVGSQGAVPRSILDGWRRSLARAWRVVRHRFWNHRVAATHLVFFIIAAAIFVPVVVGLFLYTRDLAETQNDGTAGLASRASAALVEMTSTPGMRAGSASTYWEKTGTIAGVDQVGIRDENSSSLSYSKIDNLQRAGLDADPTDGYLNYGEMRPSLNLGSKFDLHIRNYPVIPPTGADPHGAAPIKGTRVAYVANLTSHNIQLDPLADDHREFTNPVAGAAKDIAALNLLGLDTTNLLDGEYYQPANANGLLYPLNAYLNVAVKDGNVIADTDRKYQPGLLARPYHQSFVYFHFKDGADYRYDAIIFGSDVDLARWSAYAANLTAFVNDGGVVIFLGTKNLPADFVDDCVSASCLFWQQGTGQPLTTPDPANQIMTIPNRLTGLKQGGATAWTICGNELKGFIPVIATAGGGGTCWDSDLGMTSSDRYGQTGGTVILSRFALDTMADGDVAKVLSNYLNYAMLRPLFLDYGREIPEDEPVATATRLMTVQLPNGSARDVKVILYLWRRA